LQAEFPKTLSYYPLSRHQRPGRRAGPYKILSTTNNGKMKILFISGREPSYVRNAMILKSLKKNGVEIVDCTAQSTTYPARYLTVLTKFLLKRKDDFDLVFVGFFGQPLVPLIKKLTDKPIIFDAFLSAYDTMCFDRKIFKPDSAAGKFFYWLDRYSCENSDRILLDTNAQIGYFVSTFGIPEDKFQRLFVGAEDFLFYPAEEITDSRQITVFYYSTYLPLHGTEYIIRAAGMVEQNSSIKFRIIGKGPQLKPVRRRAKMLGVANIDFVDWVPYEKLPSEIAQADICLGGHFSGIEKAGRVIAGKTYQFLAMKKPVIVGDCPANRELLTHRQNAFFVKMADAGSLADAILELSGDAALRKRLSEEGYKTFTEKCNTSAIGKELQKMFRSFRRQQES